MVYQLLTSYFSLKVFAFLLKIAKIGFCFPDSNSNRHITLVAPGFKSVLIYDRSSVANYSSNYSFMAAKSSDQSTELAFLTH